MMTDLDDFTIGIVARLLEARTGQQLTEDRQWRVANVLRSFLRDTGIGSSNDMVARLTDPSDDQFANKVVEAILNHETYFFRDWQMFDVLEQQILPELARARAGCRTLRIWSAGCSSGQETYSLAMIFARQPQLWKDWRIDILGTDVSDVSVAMARRGHYSHFEVQRGLGVNELLLHMQEVPGGWQIREGLKAMVRFEVQNVLDAAPAPGHFDLVLCRNVLLYFAASTRRRAFERLAQAMAPGGFLMLGSGETTGEHTESFHSSAAGPGIFRLNPTTESQKSEIAEKLLKIGQCQH